VDHNDHIRGGIIKVTTARLPFWMPSLRTGCGVLISLAPLLALLSPIRRPSFSLLNIRICPSSRQGIPAALYSQYSTMSSQLKPIKLYGFGQTANPMKVAFLLEELQIPWENVPVSMAEVKGQAYTSINPNGRLPAIYDPNTDLTLWESGAILEYLVEKYDKGTRVSFAPETSEYWHARQWLYFQGKLCTGSSHSSRPSPARRTPYRHIQLTTGSVSGQGPYYGQLGWFKLFAPDPDPMAITRYTDEVNRVSSVLERCLEQQKKKHSTADGPWLVGNRYSYADVSFIPWQVVMEVALKDVYDMGKFPHLQDWYNRITSRDAVRKVLEHPARSGGH
jgi:glutathione S-transferase